MKKRFLIIPLILILLAAGGFGGWLWYDNNVDRSGFGEENGIRYYQDFHGDKVTGWQDINGQTFYFLSDYSMATHWQQIGGRTYYFGGDGMLVSGWQEIGGQLHHFGDDGILTTGWLEADGHTCYFDSDGILVTGWQEIDGGRYYFDADGMMVTGRVVLDGQTYCFADDGTMTTGWADNYYYLSDGTMATGAQEIGGIAYLFNEDGTPFSGWLQEGEYSYYYLEDGTTAAGPTQIDGTTYYFTPSGIHILLVNPWNYVPEDYEVELVAAEGGFRVAASCYDALMQMIYDCRAAGCYPNLCSGYRTYWDQVYVYNAKIAEYGEARGKELAAVPGTSEHHLGLAVDITGNSAMVWLAEHCWEYGFILRYTEEKQPITGIADEPWHFRYVGVEVAMDMKDSGLCLEEYLGAYAAPEEEPETEIQPEETE